MDREGRGELIDRGKEMLNLTRRALLLGGTSTLGVLALPVWSQPSADYYSEYRRGLINRHIARNGCLMQQIWMVPSAPNQATDAVWQTIARTPLIIIIAVTAGDILTTLITG